MDTSKVIDMRFILLWCCIIMEVVHGRNNAVDLNPKAVEKWYDKMASADGRKLTKLHLYSREIASGGNPTVVQIARWANNTDTGIIAFGRTVVVDDTLASESYKIIGRVQGIYSWTTSTPQTAEDGPASTGVFSMVFTQGEYKGSTISLLCNDPIFPKYRELPVVGGSGIFRLAQGSVIEETISGAPNGDALVKFTAFIVHY
ncbi:OLC1v1012057C1 [Oldenlandia corymbosa var. corymbosa]|uniref:Dirigent protein n=1 Tax=Oldenlandia corymbosa var. corymbosa TaxID=529605 RepID=A0AAV1DY97_OLDCO|nr:OLC1v1012057C1 [Oldenlandia corymbosa var. corymbosa]